MTTNKNQHFVPRCYLRPFTVDEADAAINLYNIDRKKFITNAPVKNQCSGDYFYGQDNLLEKGIQLVESGYGAALREILKPGYRLTDQHKTILRTFWLFQYLRTEAAAMRSVELADATVEMVGIEQAEFRLEIKDAVQQAMQTFAECMHIFDDLKVCLIRNKSGIPFVTSDDPAILTNKWHIREKKSLGKSFGLSSAGALAILPISPTFLCLVYDGDVYNVTHTHGIVDVKSERDINAFNQHQFLNCRANLFVRSSDHAEWVHNNYLKVEDIRPLERHAIYYAVKEKVFGDHTRYVVIDKDKRGGHAEALMHSQVIHPEQSIWPIQIKIRKNGSVYTNGTGLGYLRYYGTLQHPRSNFIRERP